ncbi:MAG: barstar family protein [Gammaproteobacteria bacterium]
MPAKVTLPQLQEWLAAPTPLLFLPAGIPLSEVLAALRRRGLDARAMDLAAVADKAELLSAMHQTLALDGWFGFNWDALEEALYGPEDRAAPERVLVCGSFLGFRERAPADAEVFLDIVRTVAGEPGSGLRGCVMIG